MPRSGQKKTARRGRVAAVEVPLVPGSSRAPAPAPAPAARQAQLQEELRENTRNIADGAKANQPKNTKRKYGASAERMAGTLRVYPPFPPFLPSYFPPSFLPKLQGAHSAAGLVRRQSLGRRGHGLGAEALPVPQHRSDRPGIPGTRICGPPQEKAGRSPRSPRTCREEAEGEGPSRRGSHRHRHRRHRPGSGQRQRGGGARA